MDPHWRTVNALLEPIVVGSFADYCNSMRRVCHESSEAWDHKTPEEKAAHVRLTVPAAAPLVVVVRRRCKDEVLQ